MLGNTARELTEAEVREIAVRYLNRREYGIEELKRKLVQRGAEPDIADQVVSDYAEQNLVSDERFTEMYVRMRLRRLFGPLKIRAELQQRGIAAKVIAAEMQIDEEVWFDAAAQWVAKRVRGELDFAARAKIHRSLTGRGFNHEQANIGIQRLKSSD
jgi:regulatory protein